jgi:hypothetical protein
MNRQDRSSSVKGSIVRLSIRLHAAAAALAVTSLLTVSRADDRGAAPAPQQNAASGDIDARLASIESLLPELSPTAPAAAEDTQVAANASVTAPRAVARVAGTVAPGLRVTLDGSGSTGLPLWYRWVQVQGPPTPLDGEDRAAATLTVPAEANSLAYLLLVGNSAGADVANLAMPIISKRQSAQAAGLRADAGDDQIGQVGRQVTLNGVRSVSSGRPGHRWIQMAGPKVSLKIEDGHIFTFVPPANGLYQFALVVAAGSEISEPDLVSVAVGVPLPPPADEPAPAQVSLKDVARTALSGISGGPSAADDLGDTFDEVAFRIDLYSSYAELMVELTRRLEEIVPAEAGLRSAWLERVFAPLTVRLIDQMRPEGLDLSRPDGQAAELTRPQRKALARQFRLIADGFRSAASR